MTLKNVERIPAQTQTQSEQKWYQRFNTRYIAPALASATAFAVTAPAYAAEGDIPDFLAPAKTAMSALASNLGAVFMVVIGIILVIITFTNSKGGLKRAG